MFNFSSILTLGAFTATFTITLTLALPAPIPLPAHAPAPVAINVVRGTPAPPSAAQVEITIPEYTQYINSTNPTDQFFGGPSKRTEGGSENGGQRTSAELFFGENEIEHNMVKSFNWTLYTPRDDAFYTRKATPRWQLTCHVTATKGTNETQAFELLYDTPFISGPSDSAVRVWCEDQARCISKPCGGDQPTVESDDL
ncbi:hypothetical protein IAT40_002433 [Kwoniella sp. CBS 6097]